MNLGILQQQLQYFLIERRLLVIAAVVGLASLLLVALGIWPAWQKIQTNTVSLRRLEQQVSKSSQRVNILSGISKADSDKFERVAIALPEFKQPLNNLMAINMIASRSGVVIDDYNLNPGVVSTDSGQPATVTATASKGVENFQFEVTLSGSLPQIEDAFAQIETSLPLMDIAAFDLNSSARLPGQYQVTLALLSRYAGISSAAVAKQPVAAMNAEQTAIMETLQKFTLPGEGSDITPREYNNEALFGQ